MNRRKFLTQTAAAGIATADQFESRGADLQSTDGQNEFMNKAMPSVPRTTAGIEKYSGPWGFDQIAHLLRRTMFGLKPSDMDTMKTKSLDEAVDLLLQYTPPLSPPVATADEYYKDGNGNEFYGVKAGESWVASDKTGNFENARTTQLTAWWMGLMIDQPLSITEKMTLFWHNHFVSEAVDVQNAQWMYKQNTLLRQFALGNFKELTKQITIDCAMLQYLNGNTNVKGSPNENYGRELQELFTIGKGPEIAPGNYTNFTEDDVKAAAKALTGWRTPSRTLPGQVTSTFDPTRHDTTDKQFSADYGNAKIKGRTGADGAKEVDDLLDIIFAQQETAKYIVRKFYRWFVYYVIDETTEQNVIVPLANMFRANNYEIKPVLSALLKSAHFFDPVNMGCVIKNPIDLIAGMMRAFSVKFPTASQLQHQYAGWNYLRSLGANMQMNIFNPPNVAGWIAYYQEPIYYESWITADTYPKRNQFTDSFAGNGYTIRQNNVNYLLVIDPFEFLKLISDPSNPDTIIAESAKWLFPSAVIPLAQEQIVDCGTKLANTPNYYEWTTKIWDPYKNNPTNQTYKNTVATRLKELWKFMMDMAEYQLA